MTPNRNPQSSIRALLLTPLLFVTGCCCFNSCPTGGTARTAGETGALGSPPCEPTPQLGLFGFPVALELPEQVEANGSYQWYRFKDGNFVAMTASAKITNVTSASLVFNDFKIEDVAYYGRSPAGSPPPSARPLPCDYVFNLMGATNGSGTFPVWGAPVPSGGSATSSYCADGTTPCPGPYAQYVNYSLGWRPAGAPGSTSAQDADSTTRPMTKLRYTCSPPAIAPTCGCSGEVAVPSPVLTKLYKFTMFFPTGVIPRNPHPLTLFNFNP